MSETIAPIDRLFNLFITALGVMGLAIAFGVFHDFLSVTFCIEYLRDEHPQMGITEPIPIALIWGVLATWWFGLPGGLLVGFSDNVFRRTPLGPKRVLKIVAAILILQLLLSLVLFNTSVEPAVDLPERLAATQEIHALNYRASAVVVLALVVIIPFIKFAGRRHLPDEASSP